MVCLQAAACVSTANGTQCCSDAAEVFVPSDSSTAASADQLGDGEVAFCSASSKQLWNLKPTNNQAYTVQLYSTPINDLRTNTRSLLNAADTKKQVRR